VGEGRNAEGAMLGALIVICIALGFIANQLVIMTKLLDRIAETQRSP